MFKINTIVIVGFALLLFTACETKEIKTPSGINVDFEQIGYYKGENKLRYFTFYVKTSPSVNRSTISKEMLNEIKKHGSNRMNTSGQITASFYYFDRNSTPDITLQSAQRANDLAHEKKPIASVWIMPSGDINLIIDP